MSLIDDIRRDRDQGTPGPWELKWGDPEEWPNNDADFYPEWEICAAGQSSGFMGHTPYYPWQSPLRADARRIARVPAMEAALLAAEKLAKFVERADCDDWCDDADHCTGKCAILAAFRAAMEDSK